MTNKTWITDGNGNRCSVERWGSEEAAREALASLVGCFNCSDCYNCYNCFNCSDCYRCSNCANCSYCSRCSDCYRCSNCANCSYCSRCSDCYNCSNCYDCSDCSHCHDCSNCADCDELTNNAPGERLSTPVIADIHRRLYEAVTSDGHSLAMDRWHTCETAHCRAGWIVHLAGPAGYELEQRTSTLFAAQQIYRASGYDISPCRFYDRDDVAMADIKRLAGVTA